MPNPKWVPASVLAVTLFAGGGARAEVVQVDSARLSVLAGEGAVVVDIRRPDEWQASGVIEGSHLLTFFDAAGRYDTRAWLQELARLAGPDDPLVVLCQQGVRSLAVSRFLDQRMGYRRVYNLRPGIDEWLAQGRAVVRPPATGTGTSPAQ